MAPRKLQSNAFPRAMRRPRGVVRIVGGQWKRTYLTVVDIPGLRPTPDRVRETIFNWLSHAFGGSLTGRSVLDLFAGTGALGFEAASRGADSVVLVENDRIALEALRSVSDKLQAHQVHIRGGDALDIARQYVQTHAQFDIIFLDPPFGQGWLDKAIPLAAELCNSTGVLYAESEAELDSPMLIECGLERMRADRAGDVFYHLLRRNNNE